MKTPSAAITGKLGENQRKALLTLLADEDPGVHLAIEQKIISFGPDSAAWMREHLLSPDPLLRRRAKNIVRHFERQAADVQLLSFCLSQGEDFDLEQAVMLLCRTEYPDDNPQAYGALLDQFAAQLRERLDLSAEPVEILAIINEFLFRELKFTGDEKNFYDPANSYLTRVVDRRLGNPISLSLLYLLVTRRLRLPMAGIGLPGHFLCRYQSTRAEIYVDPFRGGRLMLKGDCVKLFTQHRMRFDDSCLTPMSPRRVLLRICANLHQIYNHEKSAERADRVQRYLVALAK